MKTFLLDSKKNEFEFVLEKSIIPSNSSSRVIPFQKGDVLVLEEFDYETNERNQTFKVWSGRLALVRVLETPVFAGGALILEILFTLDKTGDAP